MKILILLLVTVLVYGCGNKEAPEIEPAKEPVIEKPKETKKELLYPTLKSYLKAIVFKDGKGFDADPNEAIFYDGGSGGIESLVLANFYKTHKQNETKLNKQLKVFQNVTLLKKVPKTALKDKTFVFLKEKNKGILGNAETQGKNNKQLLSQLNQKYKATKKTKKIMSLEEYEQLIILAEENAEYTRVEKLYKEKCGHYPDSCVEVKLRAYGSVKDTQAKLVPNPTIEVLNFPSRKSETTDKKGNYDLEIMARPYQLVRIRFTAQGYMPYVKEYRIGPAGVEYETMQHVRMPNAKENKTIPAGTFGDIKTNLGDVYTLEKGMLLTAKNKPYKGDVEAYFYNFNPAQDDMGRILRGSIRVNGGAVPASNLISYGMAYVGFYDQQGNQLDISAENPMWVETSASDPSVLADGYRKKEQTQEAFWKYWVDYSKKHKDGFMASEAPEMFPNYWVYNIQTGIWDEVPLKVIAPGRVKSVFYTRN